MIIRGARGLGDSVYVRAVVKYFLDRGEQDLTVMTKYPVIFSDLPIKVIAHDKGKPTLNIRYAPRFAIQSTNFLQDSMILANIKEPLKLSIPYQKKKHFFDTDKKIVVIKSPAYSHTGREHTRPLIPDIKVIQNIINEFKDSCYFVLLGLKNKWKFELSGIDEDLSSTNDILEIVSIIKAADLVLCQPSYFLPFAEAVDTRCIVLFAQAGLVSTEHFWRWVTPSKLITQKSSSHMIDTWYQKDIDSIFRKRLYG